MYALYIMYVSKDGCVYTYVYVCMDVSTDTRMHTQ